MLSGLFAPTAIRLQLQPPHPQLFKDVLHTEAIPRHHRHEPVARASAQNDCPLLYVGLLDRDDVVDPAVPGKDVDFRLVRFGPLLEFSVWGEAKPGPSLVAFRQRRFNESPSTVQQIVWIPVGPPCSRLPFTSEEELPEAAG